MSSKTPASHSSTPEPLIAFLIGLGPVGPKFITPKVSETIGKCGVIVGWRPGILAVNSLVENKTVFEQQCNNYREVLSIAADAARSAGEHLGVLLVDDPLTYSAGICSFKASIKGFELVIVPGVGTFQLAAAAAQVSLEESAMIVYSPAADGSIDRDDLIQKRQRMLRSYRAHYHLIVMSDIEQNLTQTAEFLLENGMTQNTQVIVGEKLGSVDESITSTDLAGVAAGCYHWMSMMVVKASRA